MKTLIKNGYLITMEDEKVRENGYVVIEDEKIIATGTGDAPEGAYDKVIDADKAVIMPGFVNAHTHAGMGIFRGYADDLPLMEWLETKIFPMEDQFNDAYMYNAVLFDIAEMIKSGTTCFISMYMFNASASEAILKSGIRAILAYGTSGLGPEEKHIRVFNEIRRVFKQYHNADNGRLKIWLGPHACYVCPPDYLKRMSALADELQTGISTHMSETEGEVNGNVASYGQRPPEFFEATGIFDHPCVVAHSVWVNDDEIAILKKHQVGVAYNPESNMKLGSGIAPIKKLLDAGVGVGLGTDGSSSNNDLSMFGEMRSAAYLQKVANLDSQTLSAWDVLRMATIEGAKILRMDDKIGKLAPGYDADLILVSTKAVHMHPLHDVVSNLVFSAGKGDVETAMVKGRLLMDDRQLTTLNEAEVIAEAERTFKEMHDQLEASRNK